MTNYISEVTIGTGRFGMDVGSVQIKIHNPSNELLSVIRGGGEIETVKLRKQPQDCNTGSGSIFSGLDDKQALRAMADECAKRGLSIMVSMKVIAVSDPATVESYNENCLIEWCRFDNCIPTVIGSNCQIVGKPKNETPIQHVNSGSLVSDEKLKAILDKTIKDYATTIAKWRVKNNADEAISKIMKTIKDYQERFK